MTHFGTPNMEHIFNSSDSHRDLTLFGSIQTPGDPDSDPSDPGTLRFWDPQILDLPRFWDLRFGVGTPKSTSWLAI